MSRCNKQTDFWAIRKEFSAVLAGTWTPPTGTEVVYLVGSHWNNSSHRHGIFQGDPQICNWKILGKNHEDKQQRPPLSHPFQPIMVWFEECFTE